MIVALTGVAGNRGVSDLAEELALLRVAAGSRVLLVCPDPGTYDPQLYDDLVIDASHGHRGDGDGGGRVQGSNAKADAALSRAGVIVVLVRPAELERGGQGESRELLDRLAGMRRANPLARVLVTVAHGSEALSPHEAGSLLVFVAQIPGARLADTLELEEGGRVELCSYHSHHSGLELDAYKTAYVLCAPEVRHLYSEVFRGRVAGYGLG